MIFNEVVIVDIYCLLKGNYIFIEVGIYVFVYVNNYIFNVYCFV